jgi:immune inhibitor A
MPPRPDLLQKLYEEDRLDEAREALQGELLQAESISPRLTAGSELPDTIRILVLLVDFDDVGADTILHGRQWFERMLFDPANPSSMRNYYLANSYGKLDITGQIYGWFRVREKLSYYADKWRGMGLYPRNTQKLVEDAIDAADLSVDFSKFDNDGPDGVVDFLLVVHAGQGYEWTMNPRDIHSHAGAITGKIVDGVMVREFATEPEDGRVGTFAHELGHLLGLPDLYDVTLHSYGLGMWSLMSYGSWGGGDGSRPVGLDAWSKARLGFLTPVPVRRNTAGLRVPCVEDEPYALKLWSEGEAGQQYFLVENRQAKGCDSYLSAFGEGLLVYHIDERYAGNSSETGHLVYLEQADGRFDLDKMRLFGWGSDAGDPFPGSGGTRTFTWWTMPDNHSNEGLPTEVSLRNIGNAAATISVDVEVTSPVILFDSYVIDDAAGDGDGKPDPGEEIVLRVRLRNHGMSCSGVAASISSDDPFVILREPVARIASIPAHDFSSYLGFSIKIAEATPEPHGIEFGIGITGKSEAGDYVSADRFVLSVPLSRLAGWPQRTDDMIFSPPAVADLDGDGRKEVVLGDYAGKVYAWNTDGTLLPGWPALIGARTTSKPAICDVDVDGNADVVVGAQDGKVYVFKKDGTLLDGWPQPTGGMVVSSPALADIDDDGVIEVVCGSKDGRVYAWNEDGTLVDGWPFEIKGYEVWMSPAVADFDDDHVPEVVVGGYGGKLYVLKSDGTPLSGWPVLFGWGCGNGSPAIADFDGDGKIEIAVAGLFSNSICVVGMDGNVRGGWPQWAYNCQSLSSPVPADIDGDGLPEIAVATSCGTILAWNADGTPCTVLDAATSEVVQYCEPLFVDLDGNGEVDGLFGTAGSTTSGFYAFGRGGRLTGFPIEVDGAVWATPAVADLDDDGYVEMVVATTAGEVHVWRFVGAKTAGRSEWSQSRGDLWNTGVYGFKPQANIPLADLAITSGDISFQPDKPRQGENLTIRIRAANTGHASADNVRINLYYDDMQDSLLIGSVVVASLAAKHDTTISLAWQVPGGQPTRLVFAKLDADDQIPERFELNNVAKQRFYLSVADLEVAVGGVEPFPAIIGDSLTVYASVRNTGADVARSFTVSFYDSTIQDSRCFAGVDVDSLAPGDHADLAVRYKVGRFREDFATILCAADLQRQVLEYYLSNNLAEFRVNSGSAGEILAPAFPFAVKNFRLSRTGLAIEPLNCSCVMVVSTGAPSDIVFESEGSDPDISRNTIVFPTEGDIGGVDLTSKIPFVVSASEEYESQPAVGGGNIVWVSEGSDSMRLMLKRGSKPAEAIRTAHDGTIANPDVSSDYVVWEERDGAGSDIWGYDLSIDRASAVCDREGDQVNPSVWDRTVVWEDHRRDGGDIYALSDGSGQPIAVSEHGGSQQHPDISDDIIVWQDSRNGNWDIYGYSLKTGQEFPMSRQTSHQILPCVSDSTVMWVDRRGREDRIMGLRFGGTRTAARVRRLEALSQDARIRVAMNIEEHEDGLTYKIYRLSSNKPMPGDPQSYIQEFFALDGDSLHVYDDTLITERKPYYYTLGVVDGYGAETFYGPVFGRAYRRAPRAFVVSSPFPNPFAHDVDIAFGLPRTIEPSEDATWPDPAREGSAVEVKIYSVDGRLVRLLKTGNLVPGYYHLSWDGRNEREALVSPGVYFITVSAQNSIFSRKAILAR